MTEQSKNKKIINYILNKLAALGFLIFIMCIYLLLTIDFDFFKFGEELSKTIFWLMMSGYALLVTVLIDVVHYKWKTLLPTYVILLHSLAGFIVFFPFMGVNPFTFISGFVGAICAFIYAVSCYLFKTQKKLVWPMLLIFPLLIGVSYIDFTVKNNWNEEVTDSSYFATFDYFNGEHAIPVSLEIGDQVTVDVSITDINGGGHGFRINDQDGDHVVMNKIEEIDDFPREVTRMIFHFDAEKTGSYTLVARGDNLKGEIDVSWEVE